MNLQQAQLLAQKVLAGEAGPEEKAALHQYITRDARDSDLAEHLFPIQELTGITNQPLPAGMEERVLLHITGRTKRPAVFRKLLRMAAAAAVLIAVCFTAYHLFIPIRVIKPMVSLTVTAGTSKEVVLADGTHIRLNGGTTLRYPPAFTGGTREVYLNGEAFFEVSKDSSHPFIIHTPDVTTTVLGTSFNIRSSGRQELCEVAVATGKVQVAASGREIFLTPGEKVIYRPGDPAGMRKDSIAIATIGAWKSHRFYYDRAPLSGILLDLERAYGLHFRVQNPALSACTYSATFQSMSPEEILQTLAFMSQVKFHHTDSLIEVSGHSCN